MFKRKWLIRASGLLVLAILAGCSKSSGSYATISGVVTHNGNPVDNGKVTFHSTAQVDGKPGTVASALTDSSGKYLIATVGKEPGIPPGLYKVTITKMDAKGAPPEGWDAGQAEASGAGINMLPKDYENVATTKLSVTLEQGRNEKNWELKGLASGSKSTVTKVP
jgi:hypothetical protein